MSNRYELKFGTDPAHNLADIDGDDDFTIFDVIVFRNYYMATDPRADVDADGSVDFFDVNRFRNAYMNEQSFRND